MHTPLAMYRSTTASATPSPHCKKSAVSNEFKRKQVCQLKKLLDLWGGGQGQGLFAQGLGRRVFRHGCNGQGQLREPHSIANPVLR